MTWDWPLFVQWIVQATMFAAAMYVAAHYGAERGARKTAFRLAQLALEVADQVQLRPKGLTPQPQKTAVDSGKTTTEELGR